MVDWFKKKRKWDLEADVVVLGTGGAGMTAALAAHAGGATVAILEKSKLVGGTTAVSGGVVWVPNNHHLGEVGVKDSRDEALGYVKRLTDGRSDDALVERFVDTAPQMVEWIESQTPLRFKPLPRYPDYHPEFPGGRPGGRSLDPGLFDANELGPWKKTLRRSAVFGMTAMSVGEATDWGVFSKPLKLPFKLLGERLSKGQVCYGGALVGKLLKALLARGVEPMLNVSARELVVEEGRVVGLVARKGEAEVSFQAKRAVILASGGFEWNKELVAQFLAARQAGDRAETGKPRGDEAHVGDGSGVGHVFCNSTGCGGN